MDIFVVRMFWEGCNDTDYLGAYSDFWKAAEASLANAREEVPDETKLTVHKMPGDQSLWLEIGQGTYYAINKLKVE